MGKRHALLVSIALASACAQTSSNSSAAKSNAEVVLWAWHGAHDLRFLSERSAQARPVSVAYLARRLVVTGQGVRPQIRSAPLKFGAGTRRTAVVRIELEGEVSAKSLRESLPTLIQHLNIAAKEEGAEALQIDFDAPSRLRPQYRELLRAIRKEIPAGMRLEMTALASWCLDDRWIGTGIVDAVVPMLFEMGRDSVALRKRLSASSVLAPECRANTGISTTDVLPPIGAPERIFVFSPGPWTQVRLDAVLEGLESKTWSFEHKAKE